MCWTQLDTHQTFDISPELSGWASINDTGLYWVSQERTCYSVWCSLLKTKCVAPPPPPPPPHAKPRHRACVLAVLSKRQIVSRRRVTRWVFVASHRRYVIKEGRGADKVHGSRSLHGFTFECRVDKGLQQCVVTDDGGASAEGGSGAGTGTAAPAASGDASSNITSAKQAKAKAARGRAVVMRRVHAKSSKASK